MWKTDSHIQVISHFLPPLSKRSLRALYQMDPWDKSKGFRKRSIWCARLQRFRQTIFWDLLWMPLAGSLCQRCKNKSERCASFLETWRFTRETSEPSAEWEYSIYPSMLSLPASSLCVNTDSPHHLETGKVLQVNRQSLQMIWIFKITAWAGRYCETIPGINQTSHITTRTCFCGVFFFFPWAFINPPLLLTRRRMLDALPKSVAFLSCW